ncbi:MAG TPA: hypothetical protein VEI97_16165, partial [bacterium]|nr:hypothetical protein [bacterium]
MSVDVELEPIPLPETRSLQRARQRQRRRKHRRRKATGSVLVVAAAAGLITALANRPEGRDSPDRRAQPPAAAAAQGVPPVLLAHKDAAGRAVSLTALVPAGDAKGGTLLLIPPGTMTEVVALGVEPVGLSLELGGPARLQATVENLLGAALSGGVVEMDDAALASALSGVGDLSVHVPERVEQVERGGRVTVLYEPGPTTLQPADVGRFLAAKGRSSDLARLARHQAFWEAWLVALDQRPGAVPSQPPELARALGALASGSVTTRLLPVEDFGTGEQGGELYRVRDEEMARLVASVFPAPARTGPGERPRVQV